MTDSVEYRLGSLDARMTNVEGTLTNISADQKSQNSKLDTLLARAEGKRASWKQIGGAVALITGVVEGVHQLSKFFHG